ncbi:adenosine deaminase [Gloeobacter kilaueensis]|uniref:Adenosine deaminase n=1 Tax=Gloeobacter kilaueensis (strain ATCC BAA-2537 / CCAP 1431/1 / ULC 316 / JS1) TaxID=1183438 RepID=U5QNP9_GLOK1|nr:adenosine deaminase [Gloeobacter kilaueensis]AGY60503.1 adenosine deaminase [Gloeobacter kilaueensis JS1]
MSLRERIEQMPKAELHVHLEGATDALTVWQMAGRNGVALPARSLEEWREFYRFRSFGHFIEVYRTAAGTMQTLADWALMVERFLDEQARQNIRYSEVFISCSFQADKLPIDQWLHTLEAAAAAGEKKHGIRMRLIADIARELPQTASWVLEFASKGKQTGLVVGLGLGGPEGGHPPERFAKVYAEARRRGLRVVAHAGETVGPESIRGALSALAVERVGHAIRCLEDPQLMDQLRAEQIPLEVCPTSNYRLGVVDAGTAHPLRQMVDAGLYCTLNSDDPAMFGTDLTSEYLLLAEQGFSWEELWQLNCNTLQATFLDASEKNILKKQWDGFGGWVETSPQRLQDDN